MHNKAAWVTERRRKYKAQGLCIDCGSSNISPENKLYCSKCRDRRNIALSEAKQRLKIATMEAYGGTRCACCGETELLFLTLDHINNDGAQHRKQIRHSADMYRWLKKNGYPPGLQVLCWNCNCGKKMNGGVCPHAK